MKVTTESAGVVTVRLELTEDEALDIYAALIHTDRSPYEQDTLFLELDKALEAAGVATEGASERRVTN